jgi:uncharacterized membrane protein
MFSRSRQSSLPRWIIPMSYAIAALIAGLTLPRTEERLLPALTSSVSPTAAMAIYSSIGSGMIALTGIVFSLSFVMVQFSATAYSPRLVLWIARDPLLYHAIGIFTATFLYALAALAWVDRSSSGKVPFITAWLVIALLLASVAIFVALIQRMSLLQINRMLTFTGDQGRRVIKMMYPPLETAAVTAERAEFVNHPVSQILMHKGRPRAIQAVDAPSLAALATASGAIVEMTSAVGDTAVEGRPLLRVFGGKQVISEQALRKSIQLGDERTFEQDPKYSLRLLVDIAIKALSPAVNDPTTAVQALDQIEDLLLRVGRRRLEVGVFRDSTGALRLVIPHPKWEDFVVLAFDEIRFYGATSVQVMRRMKAVISDLISVLPDERRRAVTHFQERLDSTILRSFTDAEEKLEASMEDRQGLGLPRDRRTDGLPAG